VSNTPAARTASSRRGPENLIMFLPYASSAFVPVHSMPAFLRGFAGHRPITPIANILRGLLLGTPVGSQPRTASACHVAESPGCGSVAV
jgi:ABC-2 type transport system permease protein